LHHEADLSVVGSGANVSDFRTFFLLFLLDERNVSKSPETDAELMLFYVSPEHENFTTREMFSDIKKPKKSPRSRGIDERTINPPDKALWLCSSGFVDKKITR
jgi:hypothetical protein